MLFYCANYIVELLKAKKWLFCANLGNRREEGECLRGGAFAFHTILSPGGRKGLVRRLFLQVEIYDLQKNCVTGNFGDFGNFDFGDSGDLSSRGRVILTSKTDSSSKLQPECFF